MLRWVPRCPAREPLSGGGEPGPIERVSVGRVQRARWSPRASRLACRVRGALAPRRTSAAGSVEPSRLQARLPGPWSPRAASDRCSRARWSPRASRRACWARGALAPRRTSAAGSVEPSRLQARLPGPWSGARVGHVQRAPWSPRASRLACRARGALARVGHVQRARWCARASKLACGACEARTSDRCSRARWARPGGPAGPVKRAHVGQVQPGPVESSRSQARLLGPWSARTSDKCGRARGASRFQAGPARSVEPSRASGTCSRARWSPRASRLAC
jgi:hypothetical protein